MLLLQNYFLINVFIILSVHFLNSICTKIYYTSWSSQTTEALTTKRKVFHNSVTTLVLHSHNRTVPIYTLIQMTKKKYKLTEGKYHGL